MNAFARQLKNDAARITRDLRHRRLIQTGLNRYEATRDAKKSKFQSWEDARQTAAEIKWDAVNHLDKYLAEFADKLETRGAKVHWASAAEQAREIILRIVKEKKARSIIKSKMMTAEEIHLNERWKRRASKSSNRIWANTSCNSATKRPIILFFPAMHLTRGEISDLFQRELGTAPTDSAEELTMIAPPGPARQIHQGGHRHQRREFRDRRDRHDFHHGK